MYHTDTNKHTSPRSITTNTTTHHTSNTSTPIRSYSNNTVHKSNIYHHYILLITCFRYHQKRIYTIICVIVLLLLCTIRYVYDDSRMCLRYQLSVYQHIDTMPVLQHHTITAQIHDASIQRTHTHSLLAQSTTDKQVNSNKVNACIYLLSQRHRIGKLQHILQQLHSNFNSHYQYDVYIFENDFTTTDRQQLQYYMKQLQYNTNTQYNFYIHSIELTTPSTIQSSDVEVNTQCPGSPVGSDWPLTYRHMCRWQSMLVQHESVLDKYDYYLRLDDDSEILSEIQYDLFQFIQYYSIQYAYALLDYEHSQCDIGLHELALTYKKQYLSGISSEVTNVPTFINNINKGSYDLWPQHAIAYNNFEAGSLQFWRSDAVQHLLDYIDTSKGIYKHRWGDAPIRTTVATLLLNTQQIHQFTDIQYKHKDASTLEYTRHKPMLLRWLENIFQMIVC